MKDVIRGALRQPIDGKSKPLNQGIGAVLSDLVSLYAMNTHTSFSLFCRHVLMGGALALLAACSSTPSKPPKDGYYHVRAGDTLYGVAKRYGQNVNTLAKLNNLTPSAKLQAGQVLRIGRSNGSNAAQTVKPVNRLQLQWPTDNAKSSIIQRYHAVQNKGLDISGYRGQTVKAAAAGTVLYVGEGVRGYGKLVLIGHNTSTITAYAHNDNILVQKDQNVRAGQAIANMGSSDTDRVKLHFEVRINGKAVDPLPYLPK